ncbi:MAG: hypothetical protein IPG64_14030 [Haliea sp.]|nr:hypothetical protein [Haliea sp.]
MRWTELGAFTPVMRTHEGANKGGQLVVEKSPATTAHFRRFALVHCALRPLFMSLSEEAQQTSVPILRHMMLEFPDDPQTYSLSDQYMIGDTVLVAPCWSRARLVALSISLPEPGTTPGWRGHSGRRAGNGGCADGIPAGVFPRCRSPGIASG